MSTSQLPGLSGSATASPATVVKLLPRCGLRKRCTSRIDDATRPGYVEECWLMSRGDDRGFPWARAVGWFSEQGITLSAILSDNGPFLNRSGDWRKACSRHWNLKSHPHKAPHAADQREAERFIKTSWRNGLTLIAYQTSDERNALGYPAIWDL